MLGCGFFVLSLCQSLAFSIYTLFKYEQDLDETNDSISDEKEPLGVQSMEQGKLAKLSTEKGQRMLSHKYQPV